MQTFSTKAQLRAALLKHHRKHDHVVLVPTMGALHAGHRALLEQARKLAGEDGVVVASIFVNPIQFNNSSDLQTYPRTPEKDLEVCEGAGVDYVFSPTPEEMYSGERSIAVEESFLSTTLCGASRPGHFSGVCTVLAKLFNLVQPTDAIFGKKDYQQLAIIRRMVRDLDFPVRIHGAEIVRHGNGLAYSSRNARLTPEQKESIAPERSHIITVYRELQARRWHAEDLQPLFAKLGEENTGRTLVAVAALEQVGLITAADRGGAKFWELVPATGKKNLADAPILKCLEER